MLERAHCWARTIMALILSVKIFDPARQNERASDGLSGNPYRSRGMLYEAVWPLAGSTVSSMITSVRSEPYWSRDTPAALSLAGDQVQSFAPVAP